jgi:hypothetical protein
MANFKDKLQVFFLGLLLGLILGGGFFLFKLDQYVKELSIYKSFTHNQLPEPVTSSLPEIKNPEKKNEKCHMAVTPPPQTAPARQIDSLALTGVGHTTVQTDSLKRSDSLSQALATREEIVLRKDELLETRSFELINVSPVASNSGISRDSLAAKMAGVRDDHAAGRQFSTVEFWTSPLNYKGYKMSRTKIVLYGVTDPESVKLFKLDDEVYLHSGSIVYHLDNTNEFRPYERVSSEAILSKLK